MPNFDGKSYYTFIKTVSTPMKKIYVWAKSGFSSSKQH
jgi:hypothetical protein